MNKINIAKAAIETLIGAKLEIIYDSKDDNNDHESYGHFISTSINPEPFIGANDHNVCINFYEDGTVQFYYDATPMPVKFNTQKESDLMIMTLCEYPVQFNNITLQDYTNFINQSHNYTL